MVRRNENCDVVDLVDRAEMKEKKRRENEKLLQSSLSAFISFCLSPEKLTSILCEHSLKSKLLLNEEFVKFTCAKLVSFKTNCLKATNFF